MTNNRGIMLISAAAKVYNRLLLNRIQPVIDPILRKNQAGFRKKRSTIRQINTLRRLFEGATHKQIPLVSTFVDFKKAFDSVNRDMMFKIMKLYGIPIKIIAAVKKLYSNSKARVKIIGKTSNEFGITTGVLQGDTLAPFLFVMVIDYVMSRSEDDHGFIYKLRESHRQQEQKLNDLDFADDIALLENSIKLANEQLKKLADAALDVGLEINVEKTEYMAFNIPSEECHIMIGNHEIKRVDDFRYLGSMMKSSENDFKRRRGLAIGAWTNLEKIWRAEHVPLELKVNIFDASVQTTIWMRNMDDYTESRANDK